MQILKRLNGVLRRLLHQVVVHAVLPVQEERGRDLKTSAQRNQQAVGDIARRVAALRGFGAVDRDVKLRVIEILLDARVGHAGHVANLFQDVIRNRAIRLDIGAVDLNIHRRRQSEIQNLRDDVGREKIKRHAGKFGGQILAQVADVIRSGMVVFVKRDENVRVGRRRSDPEVERMKLSWLSGKPDVVENVRHFRRAGSRGESNFPPGRTAARFPRCACRFWRAGAE